MRSAAKLDRRFVLLAAASLLGGCGFHPVYGPGADGATSPVAKDLSAVTVPVMAERSGMLMRQALQARLDRFGIATEKRYELIAPFVLNSEGLGINIDSVTTRVRLTGSSNWFLRPAHGGGPPIATGVARAMDGYDIINNQFFAADLENSAVTQRVAEALAEQVVAGLASYFQLHPSPNT
jgi:LPS-assembly lipoprotein